MILGLLWGILAFVLIFSWGWLFDEDPSGGVWPAIVFMLAWVQQSNGGREHDHPNADEWRVLPGPEGPSSQPRPLGGMWSH